MEMSLISMQVWPNLISLGSFADTSIERLSQLEKWRLDTVIYVIQHQSASIHISNNRKEMLRALRETFKRAGDNSTILEDFIDIGLDFAQLLQKQKSIYSFHDLKGKFDAEYLDFQDPRQAECLQDNDELEPERVLICFYPAFFKISSSETSRIIMAKGKALFSPLEYS